VTRVTLRGEAAPGKHIEGHRCARRCPLPDTKRGPASTTDQARSPRSSGWTLALNAHNQGDRLIPVTSGGSGDTRVTDPVESEPAEAASDDADLAYDTDDPDTQPIAVRAAGAELQAVRVGSADVGDPGSRLAQRGTQLG
jgi:hypothetical protein